MTTILKGALLFGVLSGNAVISWASPTVSVQTRNIIDRSLRDPALFDLKFKLQESRAAGGQTRWASSLESAPWSTGTGSWEVSFSDGKELVWILVLRAPIPEVARYIAYVAFERTADVGSDPVERVLRSFLERAKFHSSMEVAIATLKEIRPKFENAYGAAQKLQEVRIAELTRACSSAPDECASVGLVAQARSELAQRGRETWKTLNVESGRIDVPSARGFTAGFERALGITFASSRAIVHLSESEFRIELRAIRGDGVAKAER